MRWTYNRPIPACPCGAPSEDQVRRPNGAERVNWLCLDCETFRTPPPGWVDDLVPIDDVALRAMTVQMERRVRARWRRRETRTTDQRS